MYFWNKLLTYLLTYYINVSPEDRFYCIEVPLEERSYHIIVFREERS